MCNQYLLAVFVYLCTAFREDNPNIISGQDCIKAFDVCVEREYWEFDEMGITPQSNAAIDICKDQLFNKREFKTFLDDNRCDNMPKGFLHDFKNE